MSKNLTDHHNDGQTDKAEGNGYNRPHSHTEEFFTYNSDSLEKINNDNSAYQAGRDNTEKQSK